MYGATLRCKVCNQYAPDRCTCNGLSQEALRTLKGEIWDDNPDGIVPGQESGPRMNSDTGFYEE